MNRFDKKSERFRVLKGLLPVAVFCVVIGIFLSGVRSISGTAAKQEADGLRRAVIRSAVLCYALEGFYPDTLAYLEDNYGITYDEDKYVVSYEVIGSNLMPDVMVIPLEEEGVP